MKRVLAALLLLLSPAGARGQTCDGWQNDQCGQNFSLTGVNQLTCAAATIAALAGVGTRCVETDSNGMLLPSGSPCGAGGAGGGGGGTVTTVTGANGVTCSPTSPNPTCTLATATCGANTFASGSNSGSGLVCTQPNFSNLSGAVSCAQLPAFTHDALTAGGTCAIENVGLTDGGGFDHQLVGTWPNKCVTRLDSDGTVICKSDMVFDPAIEQLQLSFSRVSGQNGWSVTNTSSTGYADYAVTNDLGSLFRADMYYTGSAYPGTECPPNSLCYGTAGGAASAIQFSPNNVPALSLTQAAITLPLATINKIQKTDGSKNLVSAVAGTDYQAPLTACTDYVSVGCQTGSTDIGGTNATTTVIGIENTARMRGDILATAITAPGTPAAGIGAAYVDSTSKNWCEKDDAGNVNHGIRTNTGSPNSWVSAIADNGTVTLSQPSLGSLQNISGHTIVGNAFAASGVPAAIAAPATSGLVLYTRGTPDTYTPGAAGTDFAPVGSCAAHNFVTATNAGTLTCNPLGAGDVPCGSLPALIGNVTSAGASCLTKVVAVTETSTSATLTIGAIPDDNPEFDVVGRPSGASTLVGTKASLIAAQATKRPYLLYASVAAGTTGAWLTVGGIEFGGTVWEYPNDFIAGHANLRCVMPTNTVTAGTLTLEASLNGTAIAATAIAITSVTGTGLLGAGTQTTGSASSADTIGVEFTTSGGFTQSAFQRISCQLELTP